MQPLEGTALIPTHREYPPSNTVCVKDWLFHVDTVFWVVEPGKVLVEGQAMRSIREHTRNPPNPD